MTLKKFLMSQSWGVISEKIFTGEGEYLINHSSSIILLKNGKFVSKLATMQHMKIFIKI